MKTRNERVDDLTSMDLERVKHHLLSRLREVEPTQEHLLAHWDRLDEIGRARLATAIDEVDFELLLDTASGSQSQHAMDSLQPPSVVTLEEQSSNREALAVGEQCLAQGRVGVVIVAGGMGTRLGFEQPKGMFPIGPVSGNSLFQHLIERIVALSQRYHVHIPLYLMTSKVTHEPTVRFLRENRGFGLDLDDINIFCQGTLPTLDANSHRLLLASEGELATCPDGHGGFLDAARKSGCLEDMTRRGIDVLYYGQTDNPLLPIADATIIGHHLVANSDMTTQVVRRVDLNEKVGLFVARRSKAWVVEYSELPQEIANATDDRGGPLYWAGNMAAHLFRVPFLRTISNHTRALPVHRCRKPVAHLDQQGQRQTPKEPNAIKFEKFIFDLIHHANRTLLIESDRSVAFAPVKNPDSMAADTPTTARAAMVALHRRWLQEAGVIIDPEADVEISPLFATSSQDLRSKSLPQSVDTATYFGASSCGRTNDSRNCSPRGS